MEGSRRVGGRKALIYMITYVEMARGPKASKGSDGKVLAPKSEIRKARHWSTSLRMRSCAEMSHMSPYEARI